MRAWRQRAKSPAKRLLRKVAAVVTGLLLSLAILSGFARAQSRYFYCEAMGLLETDPCVAAAEQDLLGDGTDDPGAPCNLRQRHTDCCRVLTLPPMPAGTTVDVDSVPPAPLAALQPGTSVLHVHAMAAREKSARSFDVWRPPPASAGELRARLMVFLT